MRGVWFCCFVFLAVSCACTVGRGESRIPPSSTRQRWALQKSPYNSNFTCKCRMNYESDDQRRPGWIHASCLNMSSVCLEKCQNKTRKYDYDKRTEKICCKENNNNTVLEVTMTYTASSVQDECPDRTGTMGTFTADCTTVNLDQDCRRGRKHRDRDDRIFRVTFFGSKRESGTRRG